MISVKVNISMVLCFVYRQSVYMWFIQNKFLYKTVLLIHYLLLSSKNSSTVHHLHDEKILFILRMFSISILFCNRIQKCIT